MVNAAKFFLLRLSSAALRGPMGTDRIARGVRDDCYVVYFALIRTYSSLRSQVQTRSSPRPIPRSMVMS